MHGTKPTADAGYCTARGRGKKWEAGSKGMVLEMRAAGMARLAKIERTFFCGMLKIEGVSYKVLRGRDDEERGEEKTDADAGLSIAVPGPEAGGPWGNHLTRSNHYLMITTCVDTRMRCNTFFVVNRNIHNLTTEKY